VFHLTSSEGRDELPRQIESTCILLPGQLEIWKKQLHCHYSLSQCDQLLMLQRIPSAARNHRWQAPKGQRMRTNRVNQYRDLKPLYFESREDTTVHKMCFKCSRREIDMGPRWLKGTDVCYARNTRSCSTPGCKGSRCNMIPADGSMKYIKYRDLIDRVEGGQKFAFR